MSNLSSNSIKKFETKTTGKRAARPGKGFSLCISNKNGNDIIKIIKPLEDSCLLNDVFSKTLKHKIKKQNLDVLELC